jgi:hypothetical protein
VKLLKPLRSMLAVAMTSLSFAALAANELTVYTALEPEDMGKYAARFNQDHPDVKINWVRDSTGVITARLLAEKANPQADAVWGLAATSLMLLQKEDMLQGYAAKDVDQLKPLFRDSQNPPTWVGMDAWMAAICFNTVEAAKHNLPMPKSWQDLTNPVSSGVIGHRFSGRLGLAADLWRREGLELHGRPAPEHQAIHPFRLQALQDGRHRRGANRHLLRLPWRQRESRWRTAGADLPKRRPGLGNGSGRHPQGHQATACGTNPDGLGG